MKAFVTALFLCSPLFLGSCILAAAGAGAGAGVAVGESKSSDAQAKSGAERHKSDLDGQ
jgi:hypothetical protein